MANIIPALPQGLVPCARSPDFTPATLPAKLQAAHSTKAGTWGLLHVLSGSGRYTLEPPNEAEFILLAGDKLVIETQVEHHVAFVEPGRFYIEFWKMP